MFFYRNVPKPNLPYGDAHKLSSNYYVTRDKRKSALPPLKINTPKELIGNHQTRSEIFHLLLWSH